MAVDLFLCSKREISLKIFSRALLAIHFKPNYNKDVAKILRKYSLHVENSSHGFIEAVHQWQ